MLCLFYILTINWIILCNKLNFHRRDYIDHCKSHENSKQTASNYLGDGGGGADFPIQNEKMLHYLYIYLHSKGSGIVRKQNLLPCGNTIKCLSQKCDC